MTATTVLTPAEILASEPKRKRGLKTAFRKEGDRTMEFRWEVGRGRKYREDPTENVTLLAVLVCTHTKASEARNGQASYRASLYRHMVDDTGVESIKFDGNNGTLIHTQTKGAARFKPATLEAFAEYALGLLQMHTPVALPYFDAANDAPGRR